MLTQGDLLKSLLEADSAVKHHAVNLDYFLYAPDGKNNFSVMCFDIEGTSQIKCLMLYPAALCSIYETFIYDLSESPQYMMKSFFKQKIDIAFSQMRNNLKS